MSVHAQSKADYVIADGYIPLHSVDATIDTTLLSNEALFSIYGIAEHMDSTYVPYPINFDEDFAISVQLPATYRYTTIEPIMLWESNKYLDLTYHVNYGEAINWRMNPSLIIIVNKKYWRPQITCTER